MHANVAAVDAALENAGVLGRVKLLPDPAPTAAAAAAQLAVEIGAIANSLVFTTETGEPVLILTSGAHRVDTARVATLLGVERLQRADADLVRRATGQPIGGVAPVAHPARLRTLVDTDLAHYPVVWAAGGIPHAVFATTFDELVRITGGQPSAVGD
jgi:prolyl-tRNA editing enzyme YbaK/EbsC (Cys-tRNA(Pro) deacylase)